MNKVTKETLMEELIHSGSMILKPEYEAIGDELVNEGLAQKMGIPLMMRYSPTEKGIKLYNNSTI